MNIENETFEAVCVDANNRVCLTEGKIYLVKQSKEFDNHYTLTNDSGATDDYFKNRFKKVEEEKVEDKKIKVRCVRNNGFENILKENEIYTVKNKADYRYELEETGESYEFNENRFEEIKEDLLMVKCIEKYKEDAEALIINKTYPVLEESKDCYLILNDKDSNDTWYSKKLFKPVPKEKEIKEYTLSEVFEMPKGTKLKIYPYDESERKIIVAEGIANNKYLYYIDDEGCHLEGVMVSSWILEKPRFTKVEEPVTTAEAFKALDEGNIIESLITGNKYLKNDLKQLRNVKISDKRQTTMFFEELEGQWIIE